MASNPNDVRNAARRELARRELARRQAGGATAPRQFVGPPATEAQSPSIGQQAARTAGLGARSIASGVMGVVNPFADLAGTVLNAPIQAYDAVTGNQSFRFPTNHATEQGRVMSDMGLPTPETGAEKASDIATQIITGTVVGGPITRAVMQSLGLTNIPTAAPGVKTASTASSAPARVLEDAGVPLDRGQREGGRFMQMLRSAVKDHPLTTDRAATFSAEQQKGFNRAVLRAIGEDAPEATQSVMGNAYRRIGNVFNSIGRQGSNFDDVLQADIAQIVDDAAREVPQSAMSPITRNVDDILAAVDETGKISGEQFIKIRSHLSALSDNADVGGVADKLESALLNSLQRTYPGQRKLLSEAVDQWRSMRIIQSAIGKGAERDISPLRLANAIGSMRNQAMSVYGMGGDQSLVSLAQAGRSVIPEAVGNSGTVPRGMMQAPLRAIATAPAYRMAQNYLYAQPSFQAGSGVMQNAMAPAAATANALYEEAR